MEMEKEFSSDNNGQDKQYNSTGKDIWGQIQGENQTDYTAKIPICLSRKRANQKTN